MKWRVRFVVDRLDGCWTSHAPGVRARSSMIVTGLADLAVHLVMDNVSTHKTPAIKRWPTAHPRFTPTPASSSWLNLVER
ncbi:hypothetical protein H4W33_007156 [Kibdelosporangium phytohabitans]|nr:hypothetical protein [Kibdelosporangium phytohabitans]